jgi:hypothetical protein
MTEEEINIDERYEERTSKTLTETLFESLIFAASENPSLRQSYHDSKNEKLSNKLF